MEYGNRFWIANGKDNGTEQGLAKGGMSMSVAIGTISSTIKVPGGGRGLEMRRGNFFPFFLTC